MRVLMLLLCLWCCPVSFQNDDTEELPAIAATERGGCPGGVCKPKRPRPRPTR
jgi:hypothetical protein